MSDTVEIVDEEDYGVRWWDDYEITGKTPAARAKQVAALEERLKRLYDYCADDVRAERAADKHLFPLSDSERQVYLLDQKINDRGVAVDLKTVKSCIKVLDKAAIRLDKEISDLTEGQVTALTQRDRLVAWLDRQGVTFTSLSKQNVSEALKQDLPPKVRRALELRQVGAKSSVKKLQAIIRMAGEDGRIRGNLLYHGASTGRFSGKGVQLQNLTRPELLKEPEDAIPYLQMEDDELIEMAFGPVHVVVADVMRSLFMSGPSKMLYAADFAQIEARVLAWIAGQDDLVEQFRKGDDIYSNFASKIYGRPINKKEHPLERQTGKTGILGLGFMLGHAKFILACAKDGITISEEESKKVVTTYRTSYSKISRFWYNFEKAIIRAVKNPQSTISFRMFKMKMRGPHLRVLLPSGRALNYPYAKVVPNKTPWGEVRQAVEISAVNSLTRKWVRQIVTPGTWTENVVQAIARDVMVEGMFRLEDAGFEVILTVHDEVIAEADEGHGTAEEFEKLLEIVPTWAEGLPVKAEAWCGKRYRK